MEYVAAETYSKEDVRKLVGIKGIVGIVLGDPYCQKRAFEFGTAELIEFILLAHELGLKTIFQSPCYMTDRVFESIMRLSQYLYKRGACDGGILVQDVGFANEMHKAEPELPLIWSQASRTRNNAENRRFFSFIKSCGVSAVELIRPELASHLQKMGLDSIYSNKEIQYSTVNRECFYIHETGVWDKDCGRACLASKVRLINEGRGMDMSVDGHMLNKVYATVNLASISHKSNTVILRGRDVDAILMERANDWE